MANDGTRRFLTKIEEDDGVVDARVYKRSEPESGPIAVASVRRTQSGLLALKELVSLLHPRRIGGSGKKTG